MDDVNFVAAFIATMTPALGYVRLRERIALERALRASPALTQLTASVRIVTLMTVALGIASSRAVTALTQLAVEDRADGQLLEVGQANGSCLIARDVNRSEQSRPTAAGCDAAVSPELSPGPTNQDLLVTATDHVAVYREPNRLPDGIPVPADAVAAPGSRPDPHTSPTNDELRAPGVARARTLDFDLVVDLVAAQTDRWPRGVHGDNAVNVIELDIALDTAAGSL